MKSINPHGLMKEIDQKTEKSCENCQDYIICLMNGNDTKNPCQDWMISLDLFSQKWEELADKYDCQNL